MLLPACIRSGTHPRQLVVFLHSGLGIRTSLKVIIQHRPRIFVHDLADGERTLRSKVLYKSCKLSGAIAYASSVPWLEGASLLSVPSIRHFSLRVLRAVLNPVLCSTSEADPLQSSEFFGDGRRGELSGRVESL